MTERRRAIVVGAEGGIGRATARTLAAAGCDLGLTWARDESDLAVSGETARLDLSEPESAAAVVEDLAHRLGGLDVLVANAGTNERAPALETDLASFRRVVDVNLVGTTAVLLAAARLMVAAGRGGRLVVVTSVHEHLPLEASLAYTASKHALGGVVKTLGQLGAAPAREAEACAPRVGVEPTSLVLIQSQAGPAGRPTGDCRPQG